MRQLQPQVVEDRKRKLLQWVIHRYIRTSVPVASQSIAEEAGLDLSSATIRNVLKELEAEGYLHQPHTSAGRVPTDKGYRFYVDFLMDVQRLAAGEKERLERQYSHRVEELDLLLGETSKLLSTASKSAGLVLSPKMERHELKRLEVLPLEGGRVLAVLVTKAGLIRHWPIELSAQVSPAQINRLNRYLNDTIQQRSIAEARAAVRAKLEAAEREFRELADLSERLLGAMSSIEEPGELFLEGATQILAHPEDLGDFRDIQSLIDVIEGKGRLAKLLSVQMERGEAALVEGAQVRIGHENALPEMKNLSLVTSTYRVGDQVVGVLGILGTKRMEYDRIVGLVNHVSDLVSRTIESWWAGGPGGEPGALPVKPPRPSPRRRASKRGPVGAARRPEGSR